MLLRRTPAGSLIQNGKRLELKLLDASMARFPDLLTLLPSPVELDTCRTLLFNFSDLAGAYPSMAASLVAWFRNCESAFEAKETEIDYDPPRNDNAERWLDEVGFTHQILNSGDALKDRPRTMVLHEVAPGVRDASERVATDIDRLISRNRLPIKEDSLSSLYVALSEVVENVTRHAQINSAAFACAQVHPRVGKFSVCVADAGIGLAESFRNAPYAPARERLEGGESPLDLAIEPLMSTKYGMGHSGYGLFYSSELCALSKGTFSITSGNESLIIHPNGRYKRSHGFWKGTIVQMLLNTREAVDGSRVWQKLPDLNEDEPRMIYVDVVPSDCFLLRTFGNRLFTRDLGARVLDAALQRPGDKLIISLEGVEVMTPSFADEFFGGLFSRLGQELFRSRVGLLHPDHYIQSLVEMVLKHRSERQ